jgi:ribosomal protein L34E
MTTSISTREQITPGITVACKYVKEKSKRCEKCLKSPKFLLANITSQSQTQNLPDRPFEMDKCKGNLHF